MKQHVFISYVRENQKEVDRLCADLEESGVMVWIDRDDIPPGMRWKEAIRNAITGGSFFLACFSNEYSGRDRSYMNEELELALDELRQRPRDRAFFIPAIISPTEIPDFPISARERLTDLQWVDLTTDWEKGVKNILTAIQSVEELPFESLPEAMNAVQEAERELKELYPSVVSLALDRLVLGGQRTTEWCIRVYVEKKLPMYEVKKEEILPPTILGFPVDVVELGS